MTQSDDPNRPKPLLHLLRRPAPKLEHLPNLLIAPEIHSGLEVLWKRSQTLPSVEYAGCLVDECGSLGLTCVTRGTDNSVEPPHQLRFYRRRPDHVGSLHTHLLYPDDDDEQYGFSAEDYISCMEHGVRLYGVRSGNHVAVLLRSSDSPDASGRLTEPECDRVYKQFQERFDKHFHNLKPFPIRVWGKRIIDDRHHLQAYERANLDFCRELKLGLYIGKVGQPLRRVR